MEKISVIIPVYNGEKYIENCIQSVLNQGYDNFEILVVNDGSRDNTLSVLQYIKDERVKIFNKENGGQGTARNLALDNASGDIIVFLDADDILLNNALPEIAESLKNSDICIFGVDYYNGAYSVIRNPKAQSLDNLSLMEKYLKKEFTSVIWDKAYRKSLWDNVRFPQIPCREDAYILHEALGKARSCVCLDKPLYRQTLRTGSTERSGFSEKMLYSVSAVESMQAYVLENYPQLYGIVKEEKLTALMGIANMIIEGFCLKKFRGIFNDNLNNIKAEQEKIKSNKADLIINHLWLYIAKRRIIGVVNNAKEFIKGILADVKGTVKKQNS